MSENQLAKNIMYYRKKKGLSQEKVSEYMGISRQAVTKWENDSSRPSSDNLIKLAQLFDVSVDALLGNEKQENPEDRAKIEMGKAPWIFIGISILCILIYVIHGVRFSSRISIGVLICMFVLCIPIQLFLHIYFSNAIRNDSFNGIAGYDDKIEYNICEVKKMLVQLNLHIGMMSTVYVFLFCVINSMNLHLGPLNEWLNGFLIAAYTLNFVTAVEIINYKMIDRIYCREDDKKRAKRGMPITVIYTVLLFTGIGITGILFKIKGIENNTIPAMKICGMLLLGIMTATTGFYLESKQIKKWDPANDYKTNKAGIISSLICAIIYGIMCIV